MLSQVIEALYNNATNIPYRNSKLTRLLQVGERHGLVCTKTKDSLGGTAVSVMLTCVAPGVQFYSETMKFVAFQILF